MSSFGKNLALWVIIGVLVLALFQMFSPGSRRGPETSLAFSDFIQEVQNGQVNDVTIKGSNITGHYADGRAFRTYAPNDPALVDRLAQKGVRITAQPPAEGPSIMSVLLSWFPFLLLIGVWIFFMRQMQSGGGRAMGFGKSRARMLTEKQGRVTFDDVAEIGRAHV